MVLPNLIATAALCAAMLQGPPAPNKAATYSLEVTEVNGAPMPSPAISVKAAPGDSLTVEVRLRDWSPNGEALRSYQVSLDPASFKTGEAGSIQPIGMGQAEVNKNSPNAFINEKHPLFVHKGKDIIQVVDAVGDVYRWMAVLFDANESPVSPQDGKKYYCGTVKMKVSDDARGTFRLGLLPANDSMVVDPGNNPIAPMTTEPLSVEVVTAGAWLRIETSDPPNGAVDARLLINGACRFDSIRLSAGGDASSVKSSDFSVNDGSAAPIEIRELRANGSWVELDFTRPISPLRWTAITHRPSGTEARIACLPGDVNNDHVRDTKDIVALVESLNGSAGRPAFQTDINGDGAVNGQDLAKLIELLEAARRDGKTRLPAR